MSNGNTQDAKEVFKEEDYLKSVDSIYDNQQINQLVLNVSSWPSGIREIVFYQFK